MRQVKTVLIYPPITDPTSGYHSLAYLDAFARAHGHDAIDLIDANIEAIDFMAQPSQVQALLAHARDLYERLGRQEALDGEEQAAYYYAWLSQAFNPEELGRAFQVLRSPTEFYDYSKYCAATETVFFWMRILSLLGAPGQFGRGFSIPTRGYLNLCTLEDLQSWDLIDKVTGPFIPYFHGVLIPQIRAKKYDVIGLNVTYTYQLPFALWMMRALKEVCPDSFLVMGGTEVSDIWKYLLLQENLMDVFSFADACVVGEGESAFQHILDSLSQGNLPMASPNLVLHPKYVGTETSIIPFQVRYEELEAIPTPQYGTLPWAKYLAPEPYVYYSPTRGCYWNKCTFCDYGLNFGSPTAPWRMDPVGKILEDLRQISLQARFIYFSVDVLAPATLLQLAERIVEAGIDIRWGAEIRLEKYWSPARCQLLKRSGCTAISVGFESGNQRILNLIDKGTRPEQVADTIRNFTDAGIAVQMMGFTHFPSETVEEAMESVAFLKRYRGYWTFGGLGEFMLTAGAIVAREPDRFGIRDIRPFTGEQIARFLYYRDPVHDAQSAADPGWAQRLSAAKRELERGIFPRPFLGGVDTAHSMFYHDRYGTDVVSLIEAVPPPESLGDDTALRLNGCVLAERNGFAPGRLVHEVTTYYETPLSEGRSYSNRTLSAVMKAAVIRKQPYEGRYFVRRDGLVRELPDSVLVLLEAVERHGRLGTVLASLDIQADQRDSFMALLWLCIRSRFITVADHGAAGSAAATRQTARTLA